MTKLLQKLSPIGVTVLSTVSITAGSMLVAPSASAVFLPPNQDSCANPNTEAVGTLALWQAQGSVLCGDKRFTFGSTDLIASADDVLIFDEITPTEYQLEYFFDPSRATPFNFDLDYTVAIEPPPNQDFFFSGVDLDTLVEGDPPNMILSTDYDPTAGMPAGSLVTLESENGNFDFSPLTGMTTELEVRNTYTGTDGNLDAFENSFFQEQIQTTPEPASILGLLLVGGLGLGLKRKKQR